MTRRLPDDTLLDRRGTSREPDDRKGFWMRKLRPSDVVAWLAIASALVGVLGLSRYSPVQLEGRITRVESQQQFMLYLQCVQLRRTDPAAVPSDCAPIFDARSRRP